MLLTNGATLELGGSLFLLCKMGTGVLHWNDVERISKMVCACVKGLRRLYSRHVKLAAREPHASFK